MLTPDAVGLAELRAAWIRHRLAVIGAAIAAACLSAAWPAVTGSAYQAVAVVRLDHEAGIGENEGLAARLRAVAGLQDMSRAFGLSTGSRRLGFLMTVEGVGSRVRIYARSTTAGEAWAAAAMFGEQLVAEEHRLQRAELEPTRLWLADRVQDLDETLRTMPRRSGRASDGRNKEELLGERAALAQKLTALEDRLGALNSRIISVSVAPLAPWPGLAQRMVMRVLTGCAVIALVLYGAAGTTSRRFRKVDA